MNYHLNTQMKIGVYSVSTPDLSPTELIEACAKFGFQGIEWRVQKDTGDTRKPWFWSGNRATLSVEEVYARKDELCALAREKGISFPSICPNIGCNDLPEVKIRMDAAVALGATALRVATPAYRPEEESFNKTCTRARDDYARVADEAEKRGVKAMIEIHDGLITPTIAAAMEILDGLNPLHAGIIWDPGNQVAEGLERYEMACDIAGEYLAEVHMKNRHWERVYNEDTQKDEWKTVFCPVDEGIIEWDKVVSVLKKYTYSGWVMMEDFTPTGSSLERMQHTMKCVSEYVI